MSKDYHAPRGVDMGLQQGTGGSVISFVIPLKPEALVGGVLPVNKDAQKTEA